MVLFDLLSELAKRLNCNSHDMFLHWFSKARLTSMKVCMGNHCGSDLSHNDTACVHGRLSVMLVSQWGSTSLPCDSLSVMSTSCRVFPGNCKCNRAQDGKLSWRWAGTWGPCSCKTLSVPQRHKHHLLVLVLCGHYIHLYTYVHA